MSLWGLEFSQWVYREGKQWKIMDLQSLLLLHTSPQRTVNIDNIGNIAIIFQPIDFSRWQIPNETPSNEGVCNVALCLTGCNQYIDTLSQSLPWLVRHPLLSLAFHSSCDAVAAKKGPEAKPLNIFGSHTHASSTNTLTHTSSRWMLFNS